MRTYFTEVIVGVLMLIILCLIFILNERNYLSFFPSFLGSSDFWGASVGATLAGIFTLSSVRKQIKYSDEKAEKQVSEYQEKYKVLLSIQLNLVRNSANHIIFMRREITTPSPYNIEPITEIKNSISNMKQIMSTLLGIDIRYLTVENFRFLGKINDKVYEIEHNFNGYLATEEEESLNHLNTVRDLAYELLRLLDS